MWNEDISRLSIIKPIEYLPKDEFLMTAFSKTRMTHKFEGAYRAFDGLERRKLPDQRAFWLKSRSSGDRDSILFSLFVKKLFVSMKLFSQIKFLVVTQEPRRRMVRARNAETIRCWVEKERRAAGEIRRLDGYSSVEQK
ncbi:hypothetical protein L596_004241 [Steinernema carpocapsae]|uniref:Uncharacterized protein n=1 Tax=Steinernema carpocapsae TaxID=34508 RepID=A0A4U8UVB1_STECR|nr:hypothetical protein L596_004241 [Steinernema carpocapsae]